MFKNIRWQLLFSFITLLLFAVIVFGCILTLVIDKYSTEQLKDKLFISANLIADKFTPLIIQKVSLNKFKALVDTLHQQTKFRITIIDSRGKVLTDTDQNIDEIPLMDNHLYRSEISAAFLQNKGNAIRYSQTLKTKMLYVAVPIKQNSKIIGISRVAFPLTEVKRLLGLIHKTMFMVTLIVFLFSIILSVILTDKLATPIQQITSAVANFTEGEFKGKIPVFYRKDEIGKMSETFSQMANQLQLLLTQLNHEKIQIQTVVSNMMEGVLAVNNEGKIIIFNPVMGKTLNVSSSKEVLNKSFIDVIRQPEFVDIINKTLKNEQKIFSEINMFVPEEHNFVLYSVPFYDNNKSKLGAMVVLHDITKIRKLERARTDFTSNVSHELKTPLTAIKGVVETLLDGALEDAPRRREFIEKIYNNCQRLNMLINDILELSKIESRRVRLNPEPVEFYKLVDSIIITYSTRIKSENLQVHNFIPDSLVINIDKEKLLSVISNLLDNAIKFNNPAGWIKVEYSETSAEHKIKVSDSGIGIPEQDMPRIFERFYRVDKARANNIGGTGLGLAIVKHTLELLNGTIEVKSQVNTGSQFIIHLPKNS